MKYYITDRQKRIIDLIEKQGCITGTELCNCLGVSLRTIRYEVASINKICGIVIVSTKNGYYLNEGYYNKTIQSDSNNNLNKFLFKLVIDDKRINIDDCADEFGYSRSSFERKLSQISAELKKYNLSIKREKNSISIIGDEKEKRALINQLFINEVEGSFDKIIRYEDFLQGIDINRINTITINTLSKFGYKIKDYYSNSLFANIYITFYRCRLGTHITSYNTNTLTMNDPEYKISEEIYYHCSKHWGYLPNYDDIMYLSILLYGRIVQTQSNDTPNNTNYVVSNRFREEIREIIDETFNYYELQIPDDDFIYSFSLHVQTLIQRSVYNQYVSNELLDSIKTNCPFIYDVSVMIANKIDEKYNVKISDEEIGFIAVHIGFLIKSQDNSEEKVKILLLTSTYHSITSLIKKKIYESYNDKVVIFEKKDICSITEGSFIDIIISNVRTNLSGKKVVIISPFYNVNDQILVENAINQYIKIKEMRYYKSILSTFFQKELFYKTNEYKTKEEVIKYLCVQLKNHGIVNEDYYDSVIKREELSSTMFLNAFAIPHSFDFLSNYTRIAVLISDEGIQWDKEKIHLVLLMAIKHNDRKIFMKTYNRISLTLQDLSKIVAITKCNDVSQIVDIISGME